MILNNIDNTKEKTILDENGEVIIKEETIGTVENTITDITPMPNNDTDNVNSTKVSLRDVIVAELQERIKISKELQQKINDSKTKPKRELYTKKIRRNNEQVADLLLALQKIDNNKKIQNETKQATNENTDQLA